MTTVSALARVTRDRLARVALGSLTEPADPRVARLVAAMGATELHARLVAERDVDGVLADAAGRFAGLDPRRVLSAAAERGIRFLVPGDAEWPEALEDLSRVEPLNNHLGPPLGLWVRGPLRLEEVGRRSVAVVGSRSATSYGGSVAGDMAAELTREGFAVVSGAAFGIDRAAHGGAIAARGSTVAVLACGVDRAYPTAHRALLAHIAETGAVVSELPPGSAPTRVRFLTRNRLIAALTQGTVVVEAALRSGALNTATWAQRLHRVVMGVPGPVTSAPSEGVHELVRVGGAQLVTRAEHVLEVLSPSGVHLAAPRRAPTTERDRLDELHRRVVEAVPLVRPATVTSIARTAGLSATVVRGCLPLLLQASLVEQADGLWRLRVPSR